MDSSLFFIMQQQIKQREGKKALREQQMFIITHMEHKVTEQACKDHEIQQERHHQHFMMMMMNGAKSFASSLSSPSLSSHCVTPTKVAPLIKKDALEEEIAKETVLHDTVVHMQTPDSPYSTVSESEKAEIEKIRKLK
eukprot:12571124-Ditylum_brightwellii.AAC.1